MDSKTSKGLYHAKKTILFYCCQSKGAKARYSMFLDQEFEFQISELSWNFQLGSEGIGLVKPHRYPFCPFSAPKILETDRFGTVVL